MRPESSTHEITRLLLQWGGGDESALGRLTQLVHEELRKLAHHYMSLERPDHTLQTTALVNEAYLRLIDHSRVTIQDRTHFFALSAQLMRHILVDHARGRRYLKRGGGARMIPLEEAAVVSAGQGPDLVALDDALQALAARDTRKARVVELRFFGGMSVRETAEALGVSEVTVMRDWGMAKAWLYRELDHGD